MKAPFFFVAVAFITYSGLAQDSEVFEKVIMDIRAAKKIEPDSILIDSTYQFLFSSRCDFNEQFPNDYHHFSKPCFNKPRGIGITKFGSSFSTPEVGSDGKYRVLIYDDRYIAVVGNKFYTYQGGQSSWGFYHTFVFERK